MLPFSSCSAHVHSYPYIFKQTKHSRQRSRYLQFRYLYVIVAVDSGVRLADTWPFLYGHGHRLCSSAVLIPARATPSIGHGGGAPVTPSHSERNLFSDVRNYCSKELSRNFNRTHTGVYVLNNLSSVELLRVWLDNANGVVC